MSRTDRMRLGLFLYPAGHHVAAWRDPSAWSGMELGHYIELARMAEDAAFDMVFLADFVEVQLESIEAASRKAHNGIFAFEPLTLLAALAGVTSRIGLIATASTSFSDPYNLARQFASLDHMSGGRIGWNVVTSADPGAAFNFGHQQPIRHADRYARAEEFVDVVLGLWDSWDEGAFPRDRTKGRYFDPAAMHVLEHRGAHFSVRGPLNIPRSPQGRPVIVHAGASEPGKALAARVADLVFAAQPTTEGAVDFYRDSKARLGAHGRHAGQQLILPGLCPVIGRTRREAEDRLDRLQKLVDPAVGLDLLRNLSGGADLSRYPLDGPLPDLAASETAQGRQALVNSVAREEGLSIRDLYLRVAIARGHRCLIGTPQDIADGMEEMFVAEGADGFNIMPPTFPEGLRDFITLVLPELRRRGLVRNPEEGETLRDRLGLSGKREGENSIKSGSLLID
ncbi:MAG TPA: LLM class flavin-dependent oxidoreductase [Sphingobium sp.]|uniref:LLM class flavin-dependent oxidoreductase n=1 Tax=Sphingobium sp. TaxID=1912891 RepID=UPI002ED356C7